MYAERYVYFHYTTVSGARGRGFESSKQDVRNAALYMDVRKCGGQTGCLECRTVQGCTEVLPALPESCYCHSNELPALKPSDDHVYMVTLSFDGDNSSRVSFSTISYKFGYEGNGTLPYINMYFYIAFYHFPQ
jgi:hypothetical protein